jgi:cytochrome-b5 reductase
LTKFQGPDAAKPVIRAYTPISHEGKAPILGLAVLTRAGGKGYLELLIKKYPEGPMSSHIHSMKVGDTLEFKGPIPKYAWSTNKHEHVALIAGGTGITPMYQLCRAILENPFDKTKVTLVYGNITKDDILLRDELHQLEVLTGGRFKMYQVLEKPPKYWKQGEGYITKEMLSSILPPPERGDDIKIFVCGPPPLYKAISGTKKSPSDQGELSGFLKELGYTKDQVYKF